MKPFALSIPEACKALGGISRATCYRMLERKELEGFKLGARSLIMLDSIEAAIARAPRLAAWTMRSEEALVVAGGKPVQDA